jgi:RNA polymerase sigma-54 factor
MMHMDVRSVQRQNQTISPKLQHAVRLLQMSSLDFGAMVRDVLGKNPFLEIEEAAGPEDEASTENFAADAPLETSMAQQDVAAGDELGQEAGFENDRELWHADAGSGQRHADDGDVSAMEMMAVETSLNTHLHGQLNVRSLSARDLTMAKTLVESLDDDGYLRTPLEELLQVAPLDPVATLEEMQIALRHVQSLEPTGVGSRSVSECLLLQIPSLECDAMRALAKTIVEDHLQALAARDVPALVRLLNRPAREIEAVCNRIRRLDPRPGWRLGSSHVAYVVPDVLVKKTRGQWSVHLNPAIVPKVKLNKVYEDLFQRHRGTQDSEMGAHLQEAKWTLRNVEQRFSTILDVAQAIVKRQRHFLEFGAMAMKPLGLREIADEVGIHESTVSRVTNNKYMATPSGVYELKYFFSRAMLSSNGSACSGTAIRGLIKDIIDAESPEAPLSDAQITRDLAGQGLVVARRTVTKYRQMLRIEAVDRRKQHAAV